MGDLQLEVLNVPAESPKRDALDYGEGINRVCYNVPDIYAQTVEIL